MVTPNGDTLADAIIGAPGYGGLDRGGAVILYGGQSWSNVTLPVSSMTSVLNEKLETTKAGFSVAGDFNLDFDEYMDFAVGAPFFDLSNADDAGNAYVYLGSGTPLTSTTTDVSDVYVQGYVDSVKIGYSLAGGDITGDGIDDYLMGCPNRADNYSWVFVFPGSGAIGGKVESWQLSKISFIGKYVGQSIAFVGNSDGDAYGDFVIGGEMEDDTRPGVVTWVPGRESYKEQAWYVGFADAGAYQFVGDVAQENLGWSVAGEGDVNGDGSLDFIAGDEKTVDRTDPGAMLFMGGPEKFLNGSGAVVGTPISANSAANVHFFLGDNDSCPCSVALNGDMNGDGYSDILVGASESNTGNGNAGRVYVVLGRADLPSSIYLSTDAAYVLESVETGEKLGYSSTFVGDTNGDSFDDFVVGAPGGDFSSSVIDSGRTYMLFGFASR
jgi:hypothetical protein